MSRPKILFVTPVLEHPPASGPTLRIENSIKALAQISELYIYSRVSLEKIGGDNALKFYRQYCKEFYFAPWTAQNNSLIKLLAKTGNSISWKIIKRNIFNWNRESEKDFAHPLKIADGIKADVIWLGYGNISYPLLKYIKCHSGYKVVLDTDSVWSRYILRELPYAENETKRQTIIQSGQDKKEEEDWGTKIADVTTAVSEIDAEYYRMLAKTSRQVCIFSNVIDTEKYRSVPPAASNFQKPCIYLAGTFWPSSPMEDAARWVIEKILPIVRRQIPNIHFYIVGSDSDKTLSDIKDPKITITGKLPSVLPYLSHADVSLVPLRFESGTRFKILEAGACGIPVVSTTLGAEGIAVEHGRDILLADEPEAFASSIVRLIKEREFANHLAENLKKLVNEKNSVTSLVQEGRFILDCLTTSSN